MQMPDTDNIHYQHAFKTGYRMAIDGKKMTSMPSNIRRDMSMRDYFQQGWEQALEDVAEIQERQKNTGGWRQRFVWFSFMILAGLGTASLMISNIEREKAEQEAILSGTVVDDDGISVEKPSLNENKSLPSEVDIAKLDGLGLLSSQQRSDLAETQKTKVKEVIPLAPVIDSPIAISNNVLSQRIDQRQPVDLLNSPIPKYIREVVFFTEISQANGQDIYHRWRTDNEILSTIKLPIKSDKYRTWSSKKMSSAWQGQWYVEVLDYNKNVIFRQPFTYGTPK